MSNDTDRRLSRTGLVTEIKWDDDGATLKHTKDMRLIEAGLKELKEAAENRNRKAQMRWVARIDDVIYYQWQHDWSTKYAHDMPWEQFLKSKLNSSDFSKLRTEKI